MHLDRLITILETVAAAGREVSATDVQRVTGLPRPTCYRLLRTLAEHRLLDEPEDGAGFRIGRRLWRIALQGQTDADICRAAAPVLKEAAVEFGEAVFLSRIRDKAVEIIHVETPDDMRRSFVHPGLGVRPIHACSCSKVVAAFSDRVFQDEVLAGQLPAYTEQTKTSASDVAREFAAIREQGYAECVEEVEVGVSSIAVPIRLGALGVAFSVGATGPIRRFSPEHRRKIGAALVPVADRIASHLSMTLAHDQD